MRAAGPPPLGLYVHWPWCVRKCPYCDFNSHPARGETPDADYLARLLDDLADELATVAGRTVESVFLGGGTPSLMPAAGVATILARVRDAVATAPDLEVTLEANPGAVDAARFEAFRAAGVSRLSIGVQSFDDAALAALGRVHDAAAARDAVARARAAGFERVNVDLMYGLPGQSPEAARADVATALELGVAHLSHYQLTIEPNTAFARAPPELPDEDAILETEAQCRAALADAGLARYEISAFARPGHRARHNLNYWRFGDYLGVGAGAHGKVTDVLRDRIERRVKVRHPRAYVAAAGAPARIAERRLVPASERPFEFVLNALRLVEGFDLDWYRAVTLLDDDSLEPALGRALALGLARRTGRTVRPTARGLELLNDLQSLFLADPPSAAVAEPARRAGADELL
ncbi:MAG: radical SAM family heme chaperone HemW [Chromatiales bacterium]|nr:radical SAM family heme chaperone HemW [Chromatiales bacterium]